MSLAEHLEKLRHFHRLVSYPSLREGASAMGISQAGLSKSITTLEEVLGVKLFLRSRSGLVLTKDGQEVLTSSGKILTEAFELEARLRTHAVIKTPSVFRIGMYDSIAVYLFAELQTYLQSLYPEVDLQMTVDTSATLSSLVSSNELDLAIGVNLNRGSKSSVEYIKLFNDWYSFYVSNRKQLNYANLPLLIHARADDAAGKTVENYLNAAIKKRGAHRIFNFETLKMLTHQGLGIGVLPTQVAKHLIKTNTLITTEIEKTPRLFGRHEIGFVATKVFLKSHRLFAEDIYRLGNRWTKT